MSSSTIIVTANNGTTDYTFALQSQNGYKSVWTDQANTSVQRRTIEANHDVKALGNPGSDVHTLVLRREEVNSTSGKVTTAKVSLQITVPKSSDITTADILNDIASMMSLFNKNFMNYFIAGETPPGDYNVTGPFNPDID